MFVVGRESGTCNKILLSTVFQDFELMYVMNQATGELSDEKLASTIYYMITDTSGLFKQKEPLKRITSMFSMYNNFFRYI